MVAPNREEAMKNAREEAMKMQREWMAEHMRGAPTNAFGKPMVEGVAHIACWTPDVAMSGGDGGGGSDVPSGGGGNDGNAPAYASSGEMTNARDPREDVCSVSSNLTYTPTYISATKCGTLNTLNPIGKKRPGKRWV